MHPVSGPFLPTTNIFDISPLYSLDIDEGLRELLVRLYLDLNRTALVINDKDSGIYAAMVTTNGQSFFPNPILASNTTPQPTYRQVYRMVVNFGALPNTGTKSVPHGITVTSQTSFTRIYGCSSNQTSLEYIPLPYVGIGGGSVELYADATNVNVVTSSNLSAYNVTYIVLEYIIQ
jgi:hypothetical protein